MIAEKDLTRAADWLNEYVGSALEEIETLHTALQAADYFAQINAEPIAQLAEARKLLNRSFALLKPHSITGDIEDFLERTK